MSILKPGKSAAAMSEQGAGAPRWAWMPVLVVGTLLYLLVERALISTGNINFVPSLLLLGAFVMPIASVTFVYGRLVPWTVRLPGITCAFLFGGVIGTVVAGNLEFKTVVDLGTLPTVAIGLSEEAAKLIVPLAIFFFLRHRTPADGLILGVASGMGFAGLETMGYGLVALLQTGGDVQSVDQLLLLRGILAPAGHGAWTGAASAALYLALTSKRLGAWCRFVGIFLVVVAMHSLWDGLDNQWAYAVIGLLSLGLLFHEFRVATRARPGPMPRVGVTAPMSART
jgi:RsiW-degrading membrane proteinase PrsW (M82 family)